MSEEERDSPTWVAPTHEALIDSGVSVVGHVPDGGLKHLIARLESDDRVTTIRLSTEEEGIALATGAWLGGSRAAVLMQSSGVGNCVNMLGLLQTCAVPALLLVTMRGQDGESNPWQVPMSQATAPTLELMGVRVRSIRSPEDVAPAVTSACLDSFDRGGGAAAVLIEQAVVGVKRFAGDPR